MIVGTVPTPATVARVLFPAGIPPLRDRVASRLGWTASPVDPRGTPGDPGLFGPGSVTWRLLGQQWQPLMGLRAALLQALSPPIITATWSTGTFERDLLGRVTRTGVFVQQQNFGSLDEVHRSARRVRAMHRTVTGTGPGGVRFDASDPHQQAWVSMTLTDSALVINERFGTGRLRRADADRFVREQSTWAALLDPRVDLDGLFADPERLRALRAGDLELPLVAEGELPTTVADLRRLMDAWTDELEVTPLSRRLLDAAVDLEGLDPRLRAAARPFVLAVLSTVPEPWHAMIAPGSDRIVERLAAEAVQWPLAVWTAVFGPNRALVAARVRVGARPPAPARGDREATPATPPPAEVTR